MADPVFNPDNPPLKLPKAPTSEPKAARAFISSITAIEFNKIEEGQKYEKKGYGHHLSHVYSGFIIYISLPFSHV